MLTFLGQGNGFINHVQLSKNQSENWHGFWSKMGSEFVEPGSTLNYYSLSNNNSIIGYYINEIFQLIENFCEFL